MNTMVAGVGVEEIEYHQETGTVRTQFDGAKTPASTAVVATLADVMDADPVELDPLYSTVDPEALDALVRVRNETDGDIHSTFIHEDHAITVYSYGVITVTPGHEPAAEKYGRNVGR
ncbi:HalOD1 output domain-containing protein [Halovivax gelatinilyticus]|uniref:HalOD1 output domain-containing protein n=1 Tax=Halovivax gelatinilyticus TaxID=2961597 RepID=UPI0020CA5E5B|nr:HalOD1 output domain-containing protein [Halovivax gelatinilyticus]